MLFLCFNILTTFSFISFMFYVIVGKAVAENSHSTSLQRVAARRVVSLSSDYFLQLLLLFAITTFIKINIIGNCQLFSQ